MCGIVGVIAKRPVSGLLLEGLKRLEYRGYDSAGIATLNGGIHRRRAKGKIRALEERLSAEPIVGNTGIGHTRWATHGKPNEVNAHPHATDIVAVVHNGIIENYRELRSELEKKGHKFVSETDTETVAHLISSYVKEGASPGEAAAKALPRLEGAFALAMIFAGHDGLIIAARRGSPLAVGYGEGEMYVGSDALALAPLTSRITYLEEGDWVELTREKAVIHSNDNKVVDRPIEQTALSGAATGKGGYRHFMLKEIFEQPGVIGDTLNSLVDADKNEVALPELPFDWKQIEKITITACGTAYYAGCVAKYWFEQVARLPVEVDIASEYRYRSPPLHKNGAMIVISQSGETADTLAALNFAKAGGQKVLAVVNVQGSSIARAADGMIQTQAGPEIGVASTKAFTAQLTVLACLALDAARARGTLDEARRKEIITALLEAPGHVNHILQQQKKVQEAAQHLFENHDVLFFGRGANYPIAMEGALKLKEISYIHAEGYPAGELKHGPIALIDEDMPVVVITPDDAVFEKTASNIQEVMARGAKVFVVTDSEGLKKLHPAPFWSMALPKVDPFIAPLTYVIPLQLLAYYTALAKGTDVDQPRNLAKSVTVE